MAAALDFIRNDGGGRLGRITDGRFGSAWCHCGVISAPPPIIVRAIYNTHDKTRLGKVRTKSTANVGLDVMKYLLRKNLPASP